MTTLPRDESGAPIQALRPGTTQTAAYTATSASISATANGVVRVLSTTDCHIAFGASPTATTSDMFLGANLAEYFRIRSEKIAAIRATADGTLYVTEMS